MATHAHWEWNRCRWCGALVNVDECFDGSERRCWCGRLFVVVECKGGTFKLIKRHEPLQKKRVRP